MFYIYIIHSETKDKYYIGHTHNLELRLDRHNTGWSKSTKAGIPWRIVYHEQYNSKSEAMKREYDIKRKKSRIYLKKLIEEGRPDEYREVPSTSRLFAEKRS
jgi:putative endonuclease